MDWINLHSSTLDSSEFIGANPVQRSTWLCLLRFCAGQENGGKIIGATTWGDRKWQQLVRVTLREVRSASDLWRWDGENLEVNFYPIEKQKEVEAKRKAGRSTVAKRWGKIDSADSSATSSVISSADTEGEGKEKGIGIGREGEVVGAELAPAITNASGSAEPSAALSPIVLTFPTNGRVSEWHLREDALAELARLYPEIDVKAECEKALGKIKARAVTAKTANGMSRFLFSWMDRATNSNRSSYQAPDRNKASWL